MARGIIFSSLQDNKVRENAYIKSTNRSNKKNRNALHNHKIPQALMSLRNALKRHTLKERTAHDDHLLRFAVETGIEVKPFVTPF